MEQRSIRFEYHLKSNSLDEIEERLHKDSDGTEEGLSFVWSSCSDDITLFRRGPRRRQHAFVRA
jgi:hypothetical protein